jgi:hypothetical protein
MDRHTAQVAAVGRALIEVAGDPVVDGARANVRRLGEVARIAVPDTDEEWALAVAGRKAREWVDGEADGPRRSAQRSKRDDVRRPSGRLLFEEGRPVRRRVAGPRSRVAKSARAGVQRGGGDCGAGAVVRREGGDGTERKAQRAGVPVVSCETVFARRAGALVVAVDAAAVELVPAR